MADVKFRVIWVQWKSHILHYLTQMCLEIGSFRTWYMPQGIKEWPDQQHVEKREKRSEDNSNGCNEEHFRDQEWKAVSVGGTTSDGGHKRIHGSSDLRFTIVSTTHLGSAFDLFSDDRFLNTEFGYHRRNSNLLLLYRLRQPTPSCCITFRRSLQTKMTHDAVWFSRPRKFGKGSRQWYVLGTVYHSCC